MKRLFLLLIAALLIGACNSKEEFATIDEMVEASRKNVNEVEVDFLHDLMHSDEVAPFTVIDTREASEHYAGFIPGSVHLSRGRLEFNIDTDDFWDATGLYKPEKDEIIVLYCKKGERSVLAAQSLQKLGYKRVFTIIGGWKKWERTYPDLYEKDLDKLSGKTATVSTGGC
jgi:rhodanese-related sulfurtransferase